MTKNKQNRRVVLIALLILAVLVTGALVGTLAKYMISVKNSDNAETAKFGLNVPNTVNLFSDSYTNVEADTAGKKIIAPGTSGYYNFEVAGTSEVAYKVSANVEVVYSEEWGSYKPLEFSLDGNTWTTLEQFVTNLNTALGSEILQPNEEYISAQTMHWRWPFSVSSENDAKDTAMGVAAAAGTAPKVTVNIEVIAAQVY